jgi:Transposase DDE domain
LREVARFFSHFSTLLSVLHPRQVPQSAGFEGAAWVRWGSFCVYGVKLHLICATNRLPLSYELTPANVAEVSLSEELLAEAELADEELARRLLGDLAYPSEQLEKELAESGILLVSERAKQRRGARQQNRDRLREPQAGFRDRRDVGEEPRWALRQDCGQDHRLHVRLLSQPDTGASSRSDQRFVGMNLTLQQHSQGLILRPIAGVGEPACRIFGRDRGQHSSYRLN